MLNTIRESLKEAMKAKDDLKRDTLRGFLAAFTNELVAKGRKPTDTLSDDEMITVLKRLGKQRRDSAEQFAAGGRPELAAKELDELKIIEAYLPQMASRDEVEKVAREKKAELNVDSTGQGKLMGAVIKALGGNADGALVKEVVASLFT